MIFIVCFIGGVELEDIDPKVCCAEGREVNTTTVHAKLLALGRRRALFCYFRNLANPIRQSKVLLCRRIPLRERGVCCDHRQNARGFGTAFAKGDSKSRTQIQIIHISIFQAISYSRGEVQNRLITSDSGSFEI